jgi:hypothetical protein
LGYGSIFLVLPFIGSFQAFFTTGQALSMNSSASVFSIGVFKTSFLPNLESGRQARISLWGVSVRPIQIEAKLGRCFTRLSTL